MTETPVEWPAILPTWDLSGYQYNHNRKPVRPNNRLGFSPTIIPREPRTPASVVVKLTMDDHQRSLFDWFYHRKLYNGTLPFMARIKLGDTFERQRVKILKVDGGQLQASRWSLTFTLELNP